MDNVYERAMREHWENSLLGIQFWEDATKRGEELARSETQGMSLHMLGHCSIECLTTLPASVPVDIYFSPAQSPSKNPVQTAVTSSPETSPKRKKSRFQLSHLASLNNLRLRDTAHPSPSGSDTTTSPEKSPAKSEKSSKKSSLRLPKLPSFKSLSLKRRGPILASTAGIVELQKPTRPSILSPSTFLPPDSPLPPIPNPPRPAFRSLYKGPSAPDLDIAPPNAPEDFHPFPRVPNQLSIVSFQEWLERQSEPRPEIVPTPHSAHISRISLMAYLNNGGTWDNISRTKSVLKLNMFFDARKVPPESLIDLDDDHTIDKGTMTDEVMMVDRAIMTDSTIRASIKKTITVVDKATMTEPDIKGSGTDKGTAETDVSMECATNELTTGDHLATDKATVETDNTMKAVATPEGNEPILKKSAAEQATIEQAGINTKCATEEQTTNDNPATDRSSMMDLDIESSATGSLATGTKNAEGKATVHNWNLYSPSAIRETATDDQATHHSAKKPEDEIKITILTLEQMWPLTEFRNLRVLKLVGMMKSYQPVIWQAVWLNPQLVTLELEMAVGLDIENPVGPSGWKPIKKGWVMNIKSWASPVYYGRGDGEISTKIGYGEYLDKCCIEKAKVLAHGTGFPVPRYLPVKHLTLTGFAVDGAAFAMWFGNLEEVHFKKDCIDCGFWLSRAQRDVRVRHSDEFGVARGGDGPSGANSIEELGEEALAELTAAVRGLGASRM
ncbi:unnamed protein product [Penicillium egyptiacum]|uniref:Uncharacterized protein n=1 Tax=Penicillium egyptiacum TaxID=1303716 RepID=A0A9W4K785_9EURO|nr:unnamed protein product [Penicillium egyptiacum]